MLDLGRSIVPQLQQPPPTVIETTALLKPIAVVLKVHLA